MHYTYVLQSTKTKTLYVGYTSDLSTRIKKHNSGQVISTKSYQPWKLLYYEAHRTKCLAMQAELFYKTGQGRRQLKRKLGLLKVL